MLTISVLEQRVGGQHRVVGLDDGGGHLGRGVHGEGQLGLLAVVDGQALQQQGAQAGASASANGVEDEEALQASAVVCQLADAVQGEVDNLLADGVVAAGEVVGRVLLAGDELLGVEQLAVGTGADLVDHSGLQIEEDSAGDVLASTSLAEEGVEGVVTATDGLVGGHLQERERAGQIQDLACGEGGNVLVCIIIYRHDKIMIWKGCRVNLQPNMLAEF